MSIKIHLIISALIAIAFVVIVQVFATPLPVFRFLVPAYIVYAFAVSGYNWWYLKRTGRFNVWVWLRVPLFLLTWFALFFLIPSNLIRGTFLLISVPIIFFFESLVGNMGQQLGWNEFILTMAGLLIGLFGLSFYFILPGVLYLVIVFAATTLVVRTSLELVPHSTMVKWVASMAIGLFATELFWVANFLPLHYSALAIITFNAVYVVWIVYYHYLYHTLTLRQIQFHLILALVLTVVIFFTTPWSIQT
jgi:hypothetical protein